MGAPDEASAPGSVEQTQQQPSVRQPTVQRQPVQPPPVQSPPAEQPNSWLGGQGGAEWHTEQLPAVGDEPEAPARAGEPPAGLRTHSPLGRGVAAPGTAAEETQAGLPSLDDDYDDEDYDDESEEGYDAEDYVDEDADEGYADEGYVDEDELTDRGPSTGREWLVLAGLIGAGVVGGALVWLGFDWLWGTLPQVALIPALVVIGGMVWIVRRVRNDDDLQTTVLSVLVGLVVTVSPAALLLLER